MDKPQIFRSKVIWDLLCKYFGPDYFLNVIEDEYGIAPGHNDNLTLLIKKHFEDDIDTLKTDQVAKELHYKQQVTAMQYEI